MLRIYVACEPAVFFFKENTAGLPDYKAAS